MKRFMVMLGLLLILLPAGSARADNNTFGIAWGVSLPPSKIMSLSSRRRTTWI